MSEEQVSCKVIGKIPGEPYFPGNDDRTSFSKEKFEQYKEEGYVERITTGSSPNAQSKSDPEVRKKLKAQSRIPEIESALEVGHYQEMKHLVAEYSDEKAKGTKEEIKSKLEDLLDELKG